MSVSGSATMLLAELDHVPAIGKRPPSIWSRPSGHGTSRCRSSRRSRCRPMSCRRRRCRRVGTADVSDHSFSLSRPAPPHDLCSPPGALIKWPPRCSSSAAVRFATPRRWRLPRVRIVASPAGAQTPTTTARQRFLRPVVRPSPSLRHPPSPRLVSAADERRFRHSGRDTRRSCGLEQLRPHRRRHHTRRGRSGPTPAPTTFPRTSSSSASCAGSRSARHHATEPGADRSGRLPDTFVMGPTFRKDQRRLRGAAGPPEGPRGGRSSGATSLCAISCSTTAHPRPQPLPRHRQGRQADRRQRDVPARVLIPSYLVSEDCAAFLIGFLIWIPFLLIDLA